MSYYLTKAARTDIFDSDMPEKIVCALFSEEAIQVYAWPRPLDLLTRQQIATKDKRLLRIVRESRPRNTWWIAAIADDTVVRILQVPQERAVIYLRRRLVNEADGKYLRKKVPVYQASGSKPILSYTQLKRCVPLKPEPEEVFQKGIDRLVFV